MPLSLTVQRLGSHVECPLIPKFGDTISRVGKSSLRKSYGSDNLRYVRFAWKELQKSHQNFPQNYRSITNRFVGGSGTDITGRPGDRTMEMNGGSTASYLARTPCVPVFLFILIGPDAKGLSDFQGRRGITSVVWWSLRPVIFGVERNEFATISVQMGYAGECHLRSAGSQRL